MLQSAPSNVAVHEIAGRFVRTYFPTHLSSPSTPPNPSNSDSDPSHEQFGSVHTALKLRDVLLCGVDHSGKVPISPAVALIDCNRRVDLALDELQTLFNISTELNTNPPVFSREQLRRQDKELLRSRGQGCSERQEEILNNLLEYFHRDLALLVLLYLPSFPGLLEKELNLTQIQQSCLSLTTHLGPSIPRDLRNGPRFRNRVTRP